MTMMDEEELADAIRSLVNHFVPVLRDAQSVEQAEEVLRNAEETDESFHRLDLVTLLSSKIEKELTMVLDREVEKQKLNDRPVHVQTQLQEKIVSNILKSSVYADLRKSILTSTKNAVQQLNRDYVDEDAETMKDSDKNQYSWGATGGGVTSSKRGGGTQYSFSEDSSVGGSSYHHSGFGFVGLERFQQIIAGLDQKNSLEERRNALTSLCKINPADILDEVQSLLKSVLFDALADQDESLSEKALIYTTRLLSNSCVSLTKSAFVSLMEHIATNFTGRKSQVLPQIKDGLAIDSSSVSRLLIKFRLMREFHLQVSKYWIRYPSESLMETIISSTVQLLSTRNNAPLGGSPLLSPIHCLALLDPHAVWFKTWIHGAFSRNHLLEEMGKNKVIVEAAVISCYTYYTSRVKSKDPLDEVEKQKLTPRNSGDMTFKSKHLEFVHFTHSLNLLTHLLRFKNGREMFPITKGVDEPVTVQKLLLALLNFVLHPITPPVVAGKKSSTDFACNPPEMTKKLFKTLSGEELPCKHCICFPKIIEALLEPVIHWMEYSNGNTTSPVLPSMSTMINVADILTYIASSAVGRSFLKNLKVKAPLLALSADLPMASKESKEVSLGPCEILCDFTVRALKGELRSGGFDTQVGQSITESFIYVCRQLYSRHDEFRLMRCSELSSAASQAWVESVRDADLARTPTPNNTNGDLTPVQRNKPQNQLNPSKSYDSTTSSVDRNNDELKWQHVLVDNLLNFAATPHGLLLLLQSGALESCAHYMFGRYSKKLQVSKCEKFGYGVLVSRISSCAAGMRALYEAGFLSLFVSEVWANLECCPDDRKITYPYQYPVEPIDTLCIKSFNSILNVFGSFPAVFEIFFGVQLDKKTSYTSREPPLSIPELLNRLVFIHDDEKRLSLFNEDQSHTFGLRLLNSICSCLDSMLLLETQYSIVKLLLDCQKNCRMDKGNVFMLDMPVIERNHLAVRMSLIGGSSERVLPKRDVNNECSDFNSPVFDKLPVPPAYWLLNNKSYTKVVANDLSKFITSTKSWQHDEKWVSKCSYTLLATISNKQPIRGNLVGEVLEKALEARVNNDQSLVIFPQNDFFDPKESDVNSIELSNLQKSGIQMILAYINQIKLMPDSKDLETSMGSAMKKISAFLKSQKCKYTTEESGVGTNKFLGHNFYPGMDWFAAVVYMMFLGDAKKFWSFMKSYSRTYESCCMWPARSYLQRNLSKSLTFNSLEPLLYCVGNNLELVVEKELPHVSSAFKMSGYSPALIAQQWLRQCFLNFLNWPDIVQYVLLCTVSGIDYQVYFCVALLNFLSRKILFHSQKQTLLVFLRDEPLVGFKISEHIEYMKTLREKYHSTIIGSIKEILSTKN